jgi:hypothetical protein
VKEFLVAFEQLDNGMRRPAPPTAAEPERWADWY